MNAPQRLPMGKLAISETEEQWDVGEIRIRNASIVVIDELGRNGLETSERQERILTAEEVEDLFTSNARYTFTEWCGIIHGYAKKRG